MAVVQTRRIWDHRAGKSPRGVHASIPAVATNQGAEIPQRRTLPGTSKTGAEEDLGAVPIRRVHEFLIKSDLGLDWHSCGVCPGGLESAAALSFSFLFGGDHDVP